MVTLYEAKSSGNLPSRNETGRKSRPGRDVIRAAEPRSTASGGRNCQEWPNFCRMPSDPLRCELGSS